MQMKQIVAGVAVPALFFSVAMAQKRSSTPKEPAGLAPIIWPADNPYSPEKAELGRMLYFDNRISADASVSCATCHDPKFGFADGQPVSTGIRGQKGGRSAPTVINRAYSLAQFWDGRAATLEDQAVGPMANPIEMGNNHTTVVSTLRGIQGYKPLFRKAFGDEEITLDRVAKAIATFERTIVSGNAPYDRYRAGDRKALSEAQVRGMKVYFDKAKCDQCHEGVNFTSNMFANIGVGMSKAKPDVGRFEVTKNPSDWGSFKTPTLREIEHTGPYMHDGSLKTLAEVVEYYDKGGEPNKNLDSRIKPLRLTAQDKSDLVEFLKALSGTGWQHVKAPAIFPQ